MVIDFVKLLEVQSVTYEEGRMNSHIIDILKKMQGVQFFTDKTKTGINIYATKNTNKSKDFPCIVAHTDTVHDIVSNLTCVEVDGKYTGINAHTMAQTGIGGDDKVGIFVALRMLNELDACKVVFFHAEEIGCVGSRKADLDFFKDCRFVLQCDRKGNKDFVTDIMGTELSSHEWQTDIEDILLRHGYDFTDGGITDVGELKELGLTIPVANMSCGYYNPHCKDEYIVIKDVDNVISLVKDICTKITKTYYHKAEKKSYGYGKTYDSFNSYMQDGTVIGDWIYLQEFDNWFHNTDVWQDAYGVYNVAEWSQSLEDLGFENPYDYIDENEETHITCDTCLDFLNKNGECPTCKEFEKEGFDLNFLKDNG